MNDCDLPDQLCNKVAQYIPKCDCEKYPKLVFKLLYEITKDVPGKYPKTFYIINSYLYIQNKIVIKSMYFRMNVLFLGTILHFFPPAILLLKAICCDDRLKEYKNNIVTGFTLKDNTIIITKCNDKSYTNDTYYYTCQITSELKKNVKNILDEITNVSKILKN